MNKNIGLIGSLLPYRGGIARFTTIAHRNLKEKFNLVSLSFKRQYPLFLYPGKSNIEPGYSDYREPDVNYIIDSMNPLSWILACRILEKNKVTSVIIVWWTFFWFPCIAFMARYLKFRGIKILFICENVKDHEETFWKNILTRTVLSMGDAFLVDNRNNAELLQGMFPEGKINIYVKPIEMDYPNPERLLEKRARLELLFCGFVRPYKGLDILLEALLLLDGKDICLTIVGEWWTKDIKLLTLLKKLKEKVEVIDRYVEEEELARYFYRADLVVLPYRDASGTGIIPMAYYYKKPVIATLVGGLPDFVEEGLSGSLVKPEDSFALAEVILEFYNRSPLVMEEGIKKVIKNKNMNWENFCETVIKGLKDMEEKGIK